MRKNRFHISRLSLALAVVMTAGACGSDEPLSGGGASGGAGGGGGVAGVPQAVAFDTYLSRQSPTRTTYPDAAGEMGSLERLKATGFGVFAFYNGPTSWGDGGRTAQEPDFMYNQLVAWSGSQWTYSPVKYWPNDNHPADGQGAQGSREHSYVSFFAYAPYQAVSTPASGFDVNYDGPDEGDAPDHDGIVLVTRNDANDGATYLYYRTSNELPFHPDESIDLLWAAQPDLYKTKETGEGLTGGQVLFTFKHALTRLSVGVKALVDRTDDHTSPAYSTALDANTKVFIESVTINTPNYYPEGKLMLAPKVSTTPVWDFDGVTARTGFTLAAGDVRYAMRYDEPNIPTSHDITDGNADGLDDDTGLTAAETVKGDFDAMEAGVTDEEQQLSATHPYWLFPPTASADAATALSVTMQYHVVTYDPQLELNSPKYYSNVTNNITATLLTAFRFEAGKAYKILLEPGLTSAKFSVLEMSDAGEYILLSSVVKEWDVKTTEVNVE